MSLTPDYSTLFEHVPADGSSIGNLKLREQLGWDEERYLAARQPLREMAAPRSSCRRSGTSTT